MTSLASPQGSTFAPFVWNTAGLLGEGPARPMNALIILNTPLPNHRLFEKIWDAGKAGFRSSLMGCLS